MRLCKSSSSTQRGAARRELDHLLSHSAGFPACFPPLWAQTSGLLGSPSEATRQAVLVPVLATPRDRAGQRSLYSDLGFILLGSLIEQRGGAARRSAYRTGWVRSLFALSYRPIDRRSPIAAALVAHRRETPQREPLRGVVHDDTARAMLGVAGHAGLFAQSASVYRLGQALLDCYHDEDTADARVLGLRQTSCGASLRCRRCRACQGRGGLVSIIPIRSTRTRPARRRQERCGRGRASATWALPAVRSGSTRRAGSSRCCFRIGSLWRPPQKQMRANQPCVPCVRLSTMRSRAYIAGERKENLAAAKQFGRG